MTALFSFRHVSLTFEGQDKATSESASVLRDFSLDIPDGGVTALVGPSGSGKSSLLRLLNRLEVPDSGSIWFRGQDISTFEVTELRRRVGMVFQRPALFPGSVADNLRVARPDLTESRIGELLSQVGLMAELGDREANRLSGGEAQRMCIVRSLLVEPEVLLLDEPTTSLDAESVFVIETLLGDLARDGLAQIWVSHDERQVERVCDHVFAFCEIDS